MGRRTPARGGLKWLIYSAILATIQGVNNVLCIGKDSLDGVPHNVKEINNSRSIVKRHYMLVSTLDGKVSALDINKAGELKWSIETGSTRLLSSSIGQLELKRNGVVTRLVPSLDGGLYQFDGDSIQAVPITADSLLKSSFKVNEDSVIVGSKETQTFGININNGQSNYVCGPNGCEVYNDNSVSANDDILVIKKGVQTIRAVDIRSGHEKWNFSVGQHEITFLEGTTPAIESDADDYDEDITISTPNQPDDNLDDVDNEVDIKVIVPHGLIVAVSKNDPSEIIWKQKFENPIAEAWILRDGSLAPVSLFDSNTIPALDNNGFRERPKPMLYLGVHDNQMYVQPSVQMAEHVLTASDHLARQAGVVSLPKVKWKPYLSSAPSRTPHISLTRKSPLIGEDKDHPTKCALQVWQEMDYPYDNGYYLFADKMPVSVKQLLSNEETLLTGGAVIKTLWLWWKEAMLSSLTTAIMIHIFVARYLKLRLSADVTPPVEPSSETRSSESNDSVEKDSVQTSDSTSFTSRYYTDFEQVHCLGKGGFGVVFEARNKVDDCNYAIKRIQLTNSDQAREKVMREVKALAKLDNVGIVRYFQAWLESPPSGWQEDKDKDLLDSEGPPTPCNTATNLASMDKKNLIHSSDFLNNSKMGGSAGFLPHSVNWLDNNTGSFGHAEMPPQVLNSNITNSDSDGIVFLPHSDKDDTTESSSSQTNNFDIPFQNYKGSNTNEDSLIVFEDSGKGSHSDSASNSHLNVLRDLHEQIIVSSDGSPTNTSPTPDTVKSQLTHLVTQRPPKEARSKLYLYIQMQLCRRENLKDWLNANTLSRDRNQLLDIFDQIAQAMDYVHDCGLMHRDLKPSNIFFSMDGVIKIGDFGLVTAMSEHQDDLEDVEYDSGAKKHTGQVGTKLYMSPEQIEGRQYGHKVDIYSMGLIFLELFYPCSTQMERIQTIMNARKLVFPGRFSRELPNECNFVKWLLTPKPEDRPSLKDILQTEMMQKIQTQQVLPAHKRNRSRTISSSSGSL